MTEAEGQRGVHSADLRTTRLAVSLSGTNLARAGDYNQRTVLQAIRLSGETTRLELVRQTGLTPPAIASITGRLIEQGLVRMPGRVRGARGQPALRLAIDPDGAFAVGLNIDRDHVSMCLLDLAGNVRALVRHDMDFPLPGAVVALARAQIGRLLPPDSAARARVLGVGVAMPDDFGRVALPHRPSAYDEWIGTDVAAMLRKVLPWPIHVDNDAAAAALGEAQQRGSGHGQTFFYILLSAGLGGGPVIEGSYYRGATLRSGEIGLMPDLTVAAPDALVQDTVSLSALRARLEAGGWSGSLSALFEPDMPLAPVVDQWIEDAARSLVPPLVGVNCLLDPGAIVIGGRLPLALIERLAATLTQRLDAFALPARAPIVPATMPEDGAVIGAAMLPFLDQVLPSDAILIQAGRR